MLYLKSELTDNQLRIYADNIAMARWLQSTVQGMLNAATADLTIPVIDAVFSKRGDTRDYWTEHLHQPGSPRSLVHNIGELLVHTQPHDPPERRYGVCTILMPALGARLTVNGRQASGHAWPREREVVPLAPVPWPFRKAGRKGASAGWTRSAPGGGRARLSQSTTRAWYDPPRQGSQGAHPKRGGGHLRESAVRPGRQTARGRAYGAREHTIAPYAAWCEAPGRIGSRAYPGAHWPAYTHTHAGYLITGSADIARAGRGSCMSPQRGEA